MNPLNREAWSERFSSQGLAKLIVGDPDSSTDALRWASLPGALDEAKHVSSLTLTMPGQTLLLSQASDHAVRQALDADDLSFIYFATHGIADASDPLTLSFLLLTGGRLYVKEIAGYRQQHAPLVVMSACQSGLALDRQEC